MRIIAGRFKGRKLIPFSEKHIRPTTDRVKETVFNKLMAWFPGATVLDLFAGTGNLSIEAISRGAESVDSVELSRRSLKVLNENLTAIGIGSEIKVHSQDVFRYLKSVTASFDVILVDPPFTEKIAHQVMEALSAASILAPDGVIVIESSQQERIDDHYPGLVLSDRKAFGDKSVSFFMAADEDL